MICCLSLISRFQFAPYNERSTTGRWANHNRGSLRAHTHTQNSPYTHHTPHTHKSEVTPSSCLLFFISFYTSKPEFASQHINMREICHIQTGQCGNQIVRRPAVPSIFMACWLTLGFFRVPRSGTFTFPVSLENWQDLVSDASV